MKANHLLRLPTVLLLLLFGAISIMLGCSTWLYELKPAYQNYDKLLEHQKLLAKRLAQAKIDTAHLPDLSRQLKQASRLPPPPPDRQIATIALRKPVFIKNFRQLSPLLWQAEIEANYAELRDFLWVLLQQPTAMPLNTLDFIASPVPDSPITLRLTWQTYAMQPLFEPCPVKFTTTRNPFQGLNATSTDRYPLARIVWLGMLEDNTHKAALIRFPNLRIHLVQIGDSLGSEHWQLIDLKANHAYFCDAQGEQHTLTVNWQPNDEAH